MKHLILWGAEEYPVGIADDVTIQFDPNTQRLPSRANTGTVVLAFGGETCKTLQAAGVIPKNRSIKAMRGAPVKGPSDESYFLTYHPNQAFFDPGSASLRSQDMTFAARYVQYGTTEPVWNHDYRWVKHLGALIRYVRREYRRKRRPVVVSCDLETIGPNPWAPDAHILTSQWSAKTGTAFLLQHHQHKGQPLRRQRRQIRWLFSTPMVRLWGTNFKSDIGWTWLHWNLRPRNFSFCTTNAGYLLDEGRSNSLETHVHAYLPSMSGYDHALNTTVDKSRMDKLFENEKFPKMLKLYAGGDADATRRVGFKIRKQLLEDPQLANFYVEILHPAIRALEHMEHTGELVDVEKLEDLGKQLDKRVEEIGVEVYDQHLSPAVKFFYSYDEARKKDKTFKDNVIRRQFFDRWFGWGIKPLYTTAHFRPKNKEVKNPDRICPPSTSKKHLREFHGHKKAGPLTKLLFELTGAAKTRSTFVTGFLKHVQPDGRFHASYITFAGEYDKTGDDTGGTNSGRLSVKRPARHTLPKNTLYAKALRSCLPAPKGWLCWAADYETGELRILADFSKDRNMLSDFQKGIDVHARTAWSIYRLNHGDISFEEFLQYKTTKPEIFKQARQLAKPVNFGIAYKMQAPGLVDYAHFSFGVIMKLRDAEKYVEEFLTVSYPDVPTYHNRVIAEARANGCVRSPFGRLRRTPLINDRKHARREERRAVNAAIQSTLSDMNLYAAGIWEKKYGRKNVPLLWCGLTHDEAYGYIEDSKAGRECLFEVCDTMSHLPLEEKFGWAPDVAFPVEALIGPHRGAMEPV